MIPERFQDYFFNDRDYLPETYEVEDKEREKLIRQLAALITDDLGMAGKPNKISNDEPDFWLLDKLLTTEEVKFMLNFKKKRTVKPSSSFLALHHALLVSLDHLLDHLAADGAGLAGGQVAVIAVGQVDAHFLGSLHLEAVHGLAGLGNVDLVVVRVAHFGSLLCFLRRKIPSEESIFVP